MWCIYHTKCIIAVMKIKDCVEFIQGVLMFLNPGAVIFKLRYLGIMTIPDDVTTRERFPGAGESPRGAVVRSFDIFFGTIVPKQAFEQTTELNVIWDVTTLMWRHCNECMFLVTNFVRSMELNHSWRKYIKNDYLKNTFYYVQHLIWRRFHHPFKNILLAHELTWL